MLCEHADAAEKVTIIPRGQALGVTFTPPEKDEHHTSREKLIDKICVSLGGRVAEEIFIGRIHGGAYADIKAVTNIARMMVTQLGMSEALGPIAYDEGQEQVFLGREYGRRRTLSERTQQLIDDEVTRIINEQLERARTLLSEHRDKVEIMGEALLERETLQREEVEMIMAGTPLPEPELDLPDEPADEADTADGAADEDPADGDAAAEAAPAENPATDDEPADDEPDEEPRP
jgi:cell division protease FtsH